MTGHVYTLELCRRIDVLRLYGVSRPDIAKRFAMSIYQVAKAERKAKHPRMARISSQPMLDDVSHA